MKHKFNEKVSVPVVPVHNFFAAATSTNSSFSKSPSANAGVSSPSQNKTLQSLFSKSDVLRAEVVWTMKCLNSHYSFNSCSDIADTFKCMFPWCDLVQQFSCGERKVSYLCTFGIAPYFADQLLEKVRSSSNYVLLFDEALNKDLHEKQIDIYVRIWDGNRVASYYQSSEILGLARAVDMLEIFNPVISRLIEYVKNV